MSATGNSLVPSESCSTRSKFLDDQNAPVGLAVEVNGVPLDDHLAVVSVTCESTLGEDSTAEIVLDLAEVSSWCKPGSDLNILLGYGDELVTAFSGTVESITLHCDINGIRTSINGRSAVAFPAPSEPLTLTLGEDVYSYERTWSGNENPRGFGQVTFGGQPDVFPGMNLNVKGVDPVFSGAALVVSVTHRLASGDWTTSAELKEMAS